MWIKYGLKAQKFLAQGNGCKQHALKGQKLLAQGIALGIMSISKAPCKGKSFQIPGNIQSFCPYRATGLRSYTPRAVPWAKSFCPFRACGAYMRKLS